MSMLNYDLLEDIYKIDLDKHEKLKNTPILNELRIKQERIKTKEKARTYKNSAV